MYLIMYFLNFSVIEYIIDYPNSQEYINLYIDMYYV